MLRRHRSRTPAAASSVVEGRERFFDHYMDLARGKRNWQLVSFALLLLQGILVAAYVSLASRARITPYVVEVDRHGRALALGPVEPLTRTDERFLRYQLSLFVRDLRTVSADPATQRDLLYRAYAHVDGTARTFLDQYFTRPGNDPRLLARQLVRTVYVTAVLPVPDSTSWRVQWEEHETPRNFGSPSVSAWEAYLTVRIVPPQTTDVIHNNPLGLYVTEINWTRVVEPKGQA